MKKSKVKQLEKQFGKKWDYRGMGHWECSDKKRTVRATASCLCDYNCGSSPRYYLYGDGKPEEVFFTDMIYKLCSGMPY